MGPAALEYGTSRLIATNGYFSPRLYAGTTTDIGHTFHSLHRS